MNKALRCTFFYQKDPGNEILHRIFIAAQVMMRDKMNRYFNDFSGNVPTRIVLETDFQFEIIQELRFVGHYFDININTPDGINSVIMLIEIPRRNQEITYESVKIRNASTIVLRHELANCLFDESN